MSWDIEPSGESENPAPAANPLRLDLLNDPQREAVTTTEGPLLVLAGAGTGKTRVLTTRIAHILQERMAYPSQVLAVTFTNKAAQEMRERIETMVGPDARDILLGTFHSLCLRILRRHAEHIGFKSDFSVIDADDQVRLVKQIMKELHVDDSKTPARMVAGRIQFWKDRVTSPSKIDDNNPTLGSIYSQYQTRLKTMNAMDFGDLLMHCITLFQEQPQILSEYHQRLRYLLVDEYQDTNVAQYLWLRLLAQGVGDGAHNICCVGDDDQSIYGWRGAEIENILRFEKDFPGAQTIRLEQNYRSTPPILSVAGALIANNKDRLGKTLFCDGDEGDKVRLVSTWDEPAEARFVASEIDALQQMQRHKLNDIAILVRAGFQTRAFEEQFMSSGIAYRVIGGLRFYERMEIRDAIAYIRATVQPANDLALQRIINLPKRGLGAKTIADMNALARENDCAMAEAISIAVSQGSVSGKTRNTLDNLLKQFSLWQQAFDNRHHAEVVQSILEQSGYLSMWKEDKSPEAPGRVDNLKELISALEEFDSIEEFLEHVSLVMDGETNNTDDMVSIMTMHGAKGLEFNTVFLTGWEEGLFPSQRSIDEKGDKGLEEERRLAYVGLTRARKRLFITHAANRRIHGQWVSALPSRFIDELPKEHLEIIESGGPAYRQQQPHPQQKQYGGFKQKQSQPWKKAEAKQPSWQKQASRNAAFEIGSRVFHQKFGYGIVHGVEGQHVTIEFDHTDTKTLMADYLEKA